ncbi:SRPBCC family protein [Mycolicibacterium fallax]|uniref:Polyketide cyclase n=2 Tax=Mycolicibacterium TaxID=1866885 RepID=A0A1X1R5K3_MYCFA|nr:SRPBCC family protein [Mycolicibacterium fallax]ORV00039.1 polyketide cyclase [Mycolicibacterium fallax]BBY99097.1 hypothetical protein MFAL_25640 [Mycolicibacterium fallax]HOW93807.1 SRPBCC family protein [Mycolicibacterium fallax]
MAPQAAPNATASVDIAADPQAVYALITDLSTLAALAEETTEMVWKKGDSAVPGAVFTGRNRNGSKTWSTNCTVTRAAAGREFGFDVRAMGIPIAHWSYQLEPTETGTRLTESTWDRRPGWFSPLAGLLTGVSDRDAANRQHIEATLARLKRRAENP